MSSASFLDFAIFVSVCGILHGYHLARQIKSLVAPRQQRYPEVDGKKKLIVISGCDRGFGYLLAESLLMDENEFLVLALALTETGIKELQALNKKKPNVNVRLFALQCDVTSDDDVRRVGTRARELLHTQNAVLFAIVNNAGTVASGDFLFFKDISSYQKVMDVNFFGQLRLTQELIPAMLDTSRKLSLQPRIINLSSVCGVVPLTANSTYNASKYAVEAWSDSLRLELEPFHIQVVKIRPGHINTQMQKDWPTSYFNNFESAPSHVKELYGGDSFVKNAAISLKDMGDGSATSPACVVDALRQSLSVPRTKPSYFVGKDAHRFWRAMSIVPTTVADSTMRSIRLSYPIDVNNEPKVT